VEQVCSRVARACAATIMAEAWAARVERGAQDSAALLAYARWVAKEAVRMATLPEGQHAVMHQAQDMV
jgi:hypothetical protein